MKRFMGMMPSDEIKIEKKYDDGYGQKVIVQAGENGWSILYADHSSQYQDKIDTSENNFKAALKILKSNFRNLKEITQDSMDEIQDSIDEN